MIEGLYATGRGRLAVEEVVAAPGEVLIRCGGVSDDSAWAELTISREALVAMIAAIDAESEGGGE